jgi:hypothetical protein
MELLSNLKPYYKPLNPAESSAFLNPGLDVMRILEILISKNSIDRLSLALVDFSHRISQVEDVFFKSIQVTWLKVS